MAGIFAKCLDDGTPYVSPSQVTSLLSCPAKWKFSYLEGMKTPTDDNLFLGSAVHKAMEEAVKMMMANVEVQPEDLEHWASEYTEQEKEKPWVSLVEPPEILAEAAGVLANLMWDWFKDSGLKPVSVENEVVMRLTHSGPDGIQYANLGFYDLEAEDSRGGIVVLDWKTAAKSPSTDAAGAYILDRKHAYALLTYADALRKQGKNVVAIATVTAVKTKVPKLCVARMDLDGKRGDEMIAWSRAVTDGAVSLIVNRTLSPNPTSFMCSKQYCAAWDLCPGSAHHIEG